MHPSAIFNALDRSNPITRRVLSSYVFFLLDDNGFLDDIGRVSSLFPDVQAFLDNPADAPEAFLARDPVEAFAKALKHQVKDSNLAGDIVTAVALAVNPQDPDSLDPSPESFAFLEQVKAIYFS